MYVQTVCDRVNSIQYSGINMFQKIITLSILSVLLTSNIVARGKKGGKSRVHVQVTNGSVPRRNTSKEDRDDEILAAAEEVNRTLKADKRQKKQQRLAELKASSIFETQKRRDDARLTLMICGQSERKDELDNKWLLDSALQLNTLHVDDWQLICERAFHEKAPNKKCITFLYYNKDELKEKLTLSDVCIATIQWQYDFIMTNY